MRFILCISLCIIFDFILIAIISGDKYRLPETILPKNYILEILASPEEPFKYTGTVHILIQCLHLTNKIVLHRDWGLKICNVVVKASDTLTGLDSKRNVPVHPILYSRKEELLSVYTLEDLNKNALYALTVEFTGIISDAEDGFVRRKLTTKYGTVYYAITNFEPLGARKAFPCFDEPQLKAVFNINIGRPEHYRSSSNMPITKTEPIKDKWGWCWDHFMTTNPISTYLVSFMIYSDEFHWLGKPKDRIRFLVREQKQKQFHMLTSATNDLITVLGKYFQIPYPFPKLDIVIVPHFLGTKGTISNPGMITIQENQLLSELLNFRQQHNYNSLFNMAQTLSVQWMSVVRLKWWSDIWLKDCLATYNSFSALNEMSRGESLEIDMTNTMLGFLHGSGGWVMPTQIHGERQSINRFSSRIDYHKSTLLLRMSHLMTRRTSMEGIMSGFLFKNSLQSIDRFDLWRAIDNRPQSRSSNEITSVTDVMNTWTNQVGYPVINVKRDYSKQTAKLTQRNFFETNSKIKNCWVIPITYITKSESDSDITQIKEWMKCPNDTVKLTNLRPSDWLLVNLELGSLSRVNYDLNNWKLLDDVLQHEKHRIPVFSRMQLIDDLWIFTAKGLTPIQFMLNFLRYLKKEKSYAPWAAATQNILDLHWRFSSNPTATDLLNVYVQDLLKPHYSSFKFATEADSLVSSSLRSLLTEFSCAFKLPDCLKDVVKYFKMFKDKRKKFDIISIELRSIVFCYAIKHGGADEFNYLLKQWKKSENISEHQNMLQGLFCTLDSSLLKKIPNKIDRSLTKLPVTTTRTPTNHTLDSNRTMETTFNGTNSTISNLTSSSTNPQNSSMRIEGDVTNANRLPKREAPTSSGNDSSVDSASSTTTISSLSSLNTSFGTEGSTTSSNDSTVIDLLPSTNISSNASNSSNNTSLPGSSLNKTDSPGGLSWESYSDTDTSSQPNLNYVIRRSRFDIAASVFYEALKTLNPFEAIPHIKAFSRRICTQKDLNAFKKYFKNKFNIIQDDIDRAIKEVKENLKWQDNYSAEYEAQLKQYVIEKKLRSEAPRILSSFGVICLNIFILNIVVY